MSLHVSHYLLFFDLIWKHLRSGGGIKISELLEVFVLLQTTNTSETPHGYMFSIPSLILCTQKSNIRTISQAVSVNGITSHTIFLLFSNIAISGTIHYVRECNNTVYLTVNTRELLFSQAFAYTIFNNSVNVYMRFRQTSVAFTLPFHSRKNVTYIQIEFEDMLQLGSNSDLSHPTRKRYHCTIMTSFISKRWHCMSLGNTLLLRYRDVYE